MKLPTDKALVKDPRFSQYVKAYAEVNLGCYAYHLNTFLTIRAQRLVRSDLCFSFQQDEDKFFEDYAASHKKLSELGFAPPSASTVLKSTAALWVNRFVVAAIVAVVAILSFKRAMLPENGFPTLF